MEDLSARIERAKQLVRTAKHAAMATVNDDGSPHNTPFFFLHDESLKHIYWGSHPESQHSKNILRTGELFVVIYEAGEGGGLYIEAKEGHTLAGQELEEGLKVHNSFRGREGKPALGLKYYTGNSPQRMWSAKPVRFWVNLTERDGQGVITRDYRQEIKLQDLLS